ncbi:MAG: SusC/RagA family TonB-linked outer membrane protein, partial [Tannerellaceae bacterium]|nr:SusC/RagA family TonB-linked outer membrane protein [Tannerellaceae bacterium]
YGFQHEHSVSITGGTQAVRYAFSTNYFDQNGLIKNMNYDRLSVRLNTDITLTGQLDLNIDLSGRFSGRIAPQSMGSDDDSAWAQFNSAYNTNPAYANRFSDGTWNIVRGEHNVIRLQEEGGLNEYKSNLYTAGIRGNYKVFNDLVITGSAAFKMEDNYNSFHTKALDYYTDFPDNNDLLTIGVNSIKKVAHKTFHANYQGLANYSKSIAKHHLGVLLGGSYLQERIDYLSAYRTNLPTGDLKQINAGPKDGQDTEGYAREYGLFSYFLRFNYNFNEKYLFEANVRRDGSSRFKKGQRWGTFPSFSVGWRVSEEAFLQEVGWMDNLKLRGSWGELGNDKIDYYPYQSTYSFNNYPFGGVLNPTAGIGTYPNSQLTWETTRMYDIGVDFTTLSNRLNFSFDYYVKTTYDVLMQLSIPATVGLSPPYRNAGKIGNKGWELMISYNDQIGKDFRYSVGFNLSDVRNKVLDIKGTDKIEQNDNYIVYGLVEGKPINSYYGYEVLGLYRTQADLDNYPGFSSSVGLGDLIYKKRTDSDSFSFDDMIYLGSNIPRFTYGINLGASYKGFDFTAFFQGVGKVSANTMNIRKGGSNYRKEHLNSWTEDNPDATFPRLVSTTQNTQSSSFWIKKGSYLRLKNARLGYTLPAKMLDNVFINRVRFYVSGSNLFTWTGLPDDVDPETQVTGRYYPQVKTFTFGLNLDF